MLELIDQTILDVEFSEVVAIGAGLVVDLAEVVSLYWSSVCAHGNALVIDSLLEDTRREEDVECWVFQSAWVISEDWLHFHLHLYFKCS